MARNKVQFQRGLSEVAFHERYGTEPKCVAELEAMRWPDGFICPGCHGCKAHRLQRRSLYQCADCRLRTSLTAGTIFERTKLPLTTWFCAMYHLTQSKNGVSAMELMRRLDVNYHWAWMLKQKLMPEHSLRVAHKQLTAGVGERRRLRVEQRVELQLEDIAHLLEHAADSHAHGRDWLCSGELPPGPCRNALVEPAAAGS